jgi:hypothetical protein
VATEQGIGIAAGEFKGTGLGNGGSGFSFADLAADRRHKFVAMATGSEASAVQYSSSCLQHR